MNYFVSLGIFMHQGAGRRANKITGIVREVKGNFEHGGT